jgi:phenylalanyl-tRNA synthetase beta chain
MFRDLVETPLSAEGIGELLTMAGFELEAIETVEGEPVLDVNVMSNRGDAASVLGLAREVLAKHPGSRATPLMERLLAGYALGDEQAPDAGQVASVRVETPQCSRYVARVFESVENGPSPGWVQERIRRVGLRPISLLVDLTNLVMLETGQPLHAFDLDRLGPRVVVREATEGEAMETLDGVRREFAAGDVLITDGDRPVAVAGVMGGLDTEVHEGTTRCLLESAHFSNTVVRATRKRLGMHTDASYRFERWVDPEGAVRAVNRFADLLGATTVPGIVDVRADRPPRGRVALRFDRCRRLLGADVTDEQCGRYLQALGFCPEPIEGGLTCLSPSWRNDVEREEDLIEEVGRVHGYEHIRTEAPVGSTPLGGVHGRYARIDRLRQRLVRAGLAEMLSHTLRDLHPLDALGERVRVRTPHSPETALLRNSILPSLADAARRNVGRELRLFEVGRVFLGGEERVELGLLLGPGGVEGAWGSPPQHKADLFYAKSVVAHALGPLEWRLPTDPDPRLHPGRQAACQYGTVGEVHPRAARACGLDPGTLLASIRLDEWADTEPVEAPFRPLRRQPPVRRDIAVELPASVPYALLERAVVGAGGDLLEHHWLFDVYHGPGVEEGHRSLGLALVFRGDHTLTDEEANQARNRVVEALLPLGARLR